MPSSFTSLEPSLTGRVLDRLDLDRHAEPSLERLAALYAAWCQKVPFDNVLKLIHVRRALPGPLPGGEAADFFESWLRHGTGGTCWAGAGALVALLEALGFSPERGIATMLAAPHLPPNHGTVRVSLEGRHYLLDTAMLHGDLLLLERTRPTEVGHAAWGLSCAPQEERWTVHWRPVHQTGGFECRIESFGASADDYGKHYQATREWSPFNHQLYARRNRDGQVVGLAFGEAVTLASDGRVATAPVDDQERRRLLVEEFGMSEEIVSQVPVDEPTPPPPGSRTAAALEP